MTRRLVALAAICGATLSLHCTESGTETDNPAGPEGIALRRSALPYDSAVAVADADRQALRDANRAFALDLYGAVAAGAAADQNLFLCTHGISTVLGMTYAGARAVTEAELGTVLHWDLPPAALHPAMNELGRAIRTATADTPVRYDTLNSLWLADDHATEQPYLDLLSEHYDTGVYLADFAGDADGARQSINSWVADQTEGLISELFGPGAVGPTTELTLTTAAYLSAPWLDRFDPRDTGPVEFNLPDGDAVEVQMMRRLWDHPFVFEVDWRAVELPFLDADLGMIFVLPNAGEFADFEATLDAARLEQIATALEAARTPSGEGDFLWLWLPRFDFAASVDLRPPLEALGMATAFDMTAADFTRIDPEGQLYVDAFVHSTTVGVDEYGTTAAAATGEVMVPSPITPTLRFDRPFVFFIYDHGTGTVLFVGRLVRPAGEARPPTNPTVTPTDVEIICDALDACDGRTLTLADCAAALAGDDPAAVEQCADCHLMGVDLCAGMPGCGIEADICAPAACAEHCPAHAF